MSDEPKIGPEAILKIFIDQNFHHDRLIWSQLQTLIALQAATVAGAYVTRGSSLSVLAIGIGALFLVLLYLYIERLRECRDTNMGYADDLIKLYADDGVKNILGEVEGHRLRLYKPMPRKKWIAWQEGNLFPSVRGHALLIAAFAGFLLMDFMALVIFPFMSKPI